MVIANVHSLSIHFACILQPPCYFHINTNNKEGETCLIHDTWEASVQLPIQLFLDYGQPLDLHLALFLMVPLFSFLNSLYFSPLYSFPCIIHSLSKKHSAFPRGWEHITHMHAWRCNF